MSIQLKVSNSLQSLAADLAEELKNNAAVFRPVYIVTQTEGMNNWLKLQIADKMGIAANIQFPKPNDLIHKVYRLLGGEYQETISSHSLNWLLFKALDENEFKNRWPRIAEYYDSDFINSDRKRMALSEILADLFDQYQIYRTDVIEEWNQNRGEDDWQKSLWLRTKELAGEHFPDKTMIGKYILNALADRQKTDNLIQNLPHVYFFGLSLITRYHLGLISELSKHINIQFLIQNPAPEDYWFEEKSEKVLEYMKRKGWAGKDEKSDSNPVLVNWGKLIQDTFWLLFQDEENLNHYELIETKEPETDSLLHKIQHSVFHNQKEELDFSESLKDGSITINSCYNPVREVEVLYNYLVDLIELKKEDLSVRDIVVMVSDIDLYASYIKAVFDNAPYKFKYTIADETYITEDGIANSLLSVLMMNEQDFTSEKVMNLLDYQSIRKYFQIDDVLKLREWVNAANIRFGIDGNPTDESRFVSWNYGLKRLMYGLCMRTSDEFNDGEDGFYPLDLVEGFDSQQAVRFVYFVENLIESIKSRKRKRSVSAWVKYVEDTLQNFVGNIDEVENEDYLQLLNQLEKYNLIEEIFTEEVSFEVFLSHFLPSLSVARRSRSFAGGGITFCSLIPMRSIPFKVVALLGLNSDKFPRRDERVSFDLMAFEKRKGDRNLKENDKHLFLETLLSAERYLYISYIGQSIKDNSVLPPSALVDELIDFVAVNSENPDDVRENFVQKHPLHGFSKNYNSGNLVLRSYLLSKQTEIIDFLGEESVEILDFQEIQIKSLQSFFKDPIKTYYNKILKIFYQDDDLSLRETEIFELDHLQKWNLKNDLFGLDEGELENYREKSVKLGVLPLKNKSWVEIETGLENIESSIKVFQRLTSGFEEEKQEIDLEIDGSRITGNIGGIYGDQLIRYSFSKSDIKYKFAAYLDFLLVTAMGKVLDLKFIPINAAKEVCYEGYTSKEYAFEELKKIVQLYKNGHIEVLPFDFSFKIELKNSDDLNKSSVIKGLNNYFDDYHYPSTNQYHIKERQNGRFNSEEFFEKYKEAAEVLILPLADFN